MVLVDNMFRDDDAYSEDERDYEERRMDVVMETIESMLNIEHGVSAKQVELKNSIETLMTAPKFLECLHDLEAQGGPVVDGLSDEERELVVKARKKVNDYIILK
jgi:hypothetical protein